MPAIRLYDLAVSPNNIKVRIALAHKGIAYERVAVDPRERAQVLEISGQPLTPVLTHGNVVMFESSAILRYLEANVAREPRIFSPERADLKAIETWEQKARGDFSAHIGIVFNQFFSGHPDDAELERANDLLEDRAEDLEQALEGRDYLVADRLTAADCAIAPLIWYGCLTERDVANLGGPIPTFFREHLKLDDRFDRVRAYVRRIVDPIA